MGYRTYLGYISKVKYDKIKNLSYSDLLKHYNRKDYIGIYEIVTELYEFGKYDSLMRNKDNIKPFFCNKETQQRYEEDYEFYVVNMQFLKEVLTAYENPTKSKEIG